MAKITGVGGKTLALKALKQMFTAGDETFNTTLKGMEGERKVAKVLRTLPEGWRVWHDLDLGGENVDHVVASAKGVFIVEVKNYAGSVLATPKGLYAHRRNTPNRKVTDQMWRQVYGLRERLATRQFVTPLLVFTGEVKGSHAGKVRCLELPDLIPYLRDQKNLLSYAQAKELFGGLDALTR